MSDSADTPAANSCAGCAGLALVVFLLMGFCGNFLRVQTSTQPPVSTTEKASQAEAKTSSVSQKPAISTPPEHAKSTSKPSADQDAEELAAISALKTKLSEYPNLPPFEAALGASTWTDASGKYSVQATVTNIDEINVELKTVDGKTVSLKRTQLCAEDQRTLEIHFADEIERAIRWRQEKDRMHAELQRLEALRAERLRLAASKVDEEKKQAEQDRRSRLATNVPSDVSSGTKQRQPSTRLPPGQSRIKGSHFGCISKDDSWELTGLAVQKDYEAFERKLLILTASGRASLFQDGEIVFREGSSFLSGLVQVRRLGETARY